MEDPHGNWPGRINELQAQADAQQVKIDVQRRHMNDRDQDDETTYTRAHEAMKARHEREDADLLEQYMRDLATVTGSPYSEASPSDLPFELPNQVSSPVNEAETAATSSQLPSIEESPHEAQSARCIGDASGSTSAGYSIDDPPTILRRPPPGLEEPAEEPEWEPRHRPASWWTDAK